MGKMHGYAYRSLNFYYDPPPAKIILAGVAAQSEASVKRALDQWDFEFGTTELPGVLRRNYSRKGIRRPPGFQSH